MVVDIFKLNKSVFDTIGCFVAEMLGTSILVFLGCMGCIQSEAFPNNHLQMIINFGFAVLISIQCFGIVSGSHINPSVTMVACIYNLVSIPMAFIYFVGQLIGAILGYGLLVALMPAGVTRGLCVTLPSPYINLPQALALEFVATAILGWVCCGVWDPRNYKWHDSVSIRFGLAIAGLACAGGHFTGCSMNPVRSFAPALWNLNFSYHWIYWVGPLSGAAASALLYKYLLRRENEEVDLRYDPHL